MGIGISDFGFGLRKSGCRRCPINPQSEIPIPKSSNIVLGVKRAAYLGGEASVVFQQGAVGG